MNIWIEIFKDIDQILKKRFPRYSNCFFKKGYPVLNMKYKNFKMF